MTPLDVDNARQLIRTGHYLAAAAILQRLPATTVCSDNVSPVLLADVLQRIGRNQEAEEIAARNLRRLSPSSDSFAHYHFVLGNVHRDRGQSSQAIEHLQMAIKAARDTEIAAWSQLRLLTAVAENQGSRAAAGRLDEVRRSLTRFGDPKPFAAFHLWLVETESNEGRLASAWRNLRIADALLESIDDVWLRGYLAVNSSVLHYYSANTDESQRWIHIAIQCGHESGHRTTLRAAHANLGFLELARGQFATAEEAFQSALKYCEPGSAHEIAILDNIADTKLECGDIEGCAAILNTLELRTRTANDLRETHYRVWGLQTKIRLLMRTGNLLGARQVTRHIWPDTDAPRHSRITTESRLVAAEALLHSEVDIAVDCLAGVLQPVTKLAPDLFAETERVIGRTLSVAGSLQASQTHYERAIRTFDTIGHLTGKSRSEKDFASLDRAPEQSDVDFVLRTIDRIRALIDFRAYPELFSREAMVLLQELGCAESYSIAKNGGGDKHLVLPSAGTRDSRIEAHKIRVDLSSDCAKPVVLTIKPRPDAKSQLAALTFQRVVHNILWIAATDFQQADNEVVWPTNERSTGHNGFVFASESMLNLLRTVRQVAATDVCVLITGETGTGKEVIAQTIHEYSRRAASPLFTLNCAAVPKELLESQLFGHRKGAFSGAIENYHGIARSANGGTLFLDEIAELPFDVQAKLLRFLELSEVHTIGEPLPTKVDVRLIFATNNNLEESVSQNRFRRDLFYRLNIIPIVVPPLRERREEVPILANFFAQRYASQQNKEPVRFSANAMQLLIFYSWPGNVRQLSNEIRRITTLAESGACIDANHLSPEVRSHNRAACESGPQLTVGLNQSLGKATEQVESEMIKFALRQSKGHVGAAARILGLSRKGLYLKRLRLGIEDFDSEASPA